MIFPKFKFNEQANGYLSEPFKVDQEATVHIELESVAPVVTLKREEDGEYANFGQTPKENNRYQLHITSRQEITLILATPVLVTKCYIMN